MHTCNAWCFDGVHALLFENTISDRAHLEPVARALAQRSGREFVAVQEAFAPGGLKMGTPMKDSRGAPAGLARGRVVIWAR